MDFAAWLIASRAEEQLRLVIYSLMGSLEKDPAGLRFGIELPEPRLHQPESGLYARVDDVSQAGWQFDAKSETGRILSATPVSKNGQRGYNIRVLVDEKRVKQYYVDAEGRISSR